MAEHRGILGILTQPLFAATTTRYKTHRVKPRSSARTVQTFDLKGVLELRGESFTIDGEEFRVSSDTWVVGTPKSGVMAKVKGVYEDGVPMATCLVIS
jgi:hypothetical protein